MLKGIPGYLKWVVRALDGTVLIDPLLHTHESNFDVWAPQHGMPGATAIGKFKIPLDMPGTKGYKWARIENDKITRGLRVEAYLTKSKDDDAPGIYGDPKYSGVIDKVTRSYSEFSIEGNDSLWLATKFKTGRTDLFADTSDKLLRYGMKGYLASFKDGHSSAAGAWTLGNFVNNGGWTTNTDGGIAVVKPGANNGDGTLVTNTTGMQPASSNNAFYADCAIEASYHLHCDVGANAMAEAGVVAAYVDANNYILGRAFMFQIVGTGWRVTCEIWKKTAGSFGTKPIAQTQLFFTNNNDPILQPRLVGLQLTSTSYQWRLLVNGQDSNCVAFVTVGAGSPTGAIGLRSVISGNSLAANAWVGQLMGFSKSNIFQPGSISVGAQSLSQVLSSTPLIDLMVAAMTIENAGIRKNPKAGLWADTIDYAATIGTDFSTSIIFRDDENIVDGGFEPPGDPLATGLTVAGGPTMHGSGQLNWYDLANIDVYGMLVESAPTPTVNDELALRNYAARMLYYRTLADTSLRLEVQRDFETVEKWRESDIISVDSSRLRLVMKSGKIMGYTFKEGAESQTIYLHQYPRSRLTAVDRQNALMLAMLMGSFDVRQVAL